MTRRRVVVPIALAAALLGSCSRALVDNFPVAPDCECEQVLDSLADIGLLGEGQTVNESVHNNTGIDLVVEGDVPYEAIVTSGVLDDLESKGVRVVRKKDGVSISVDELTVLMGAEVYSLGFSTSDWGTSDDEITAWNDEWRKRELGDEFAQQEADAVALIQEHAEILKLLVPDNG